MSQYDVTKETPLFFSNGPYQLFGVVHEPQATPRRHGFVLCSPFMEEKLWVQRVFVSFARALAQRGHHVLRFDFMGEGDSDGDFEQSSVATRLSDIDSAIGLLRERAGGLDGITLLGLRFGATLAAQAAERRPEVTRLVLWDPVVNAAPYMQEVLRSNLATQSAMYQEIRFSRDELVDQMRAGASVNIDGYELSFPLYQEASALNLLDGPRRFSGPCLMVSIGHSAQQPVRKDLEQLRQLYSQCRLAAVQEAPFWKEIREFYPRADRLFATTLEWLDSDEPNRSTGNIPQSQG